MFGHESGFRGQVWLRNPRVIFIHCMIHRYVLSCKVMPPSLQLALDRFVKIVNYIKTSDLSSRLFKTLCIEMGESFTALLYHTEVRWLSKGNVTARLFDLRDVVIAFLTKKVKELDDKESKKIVKQAPKKVLPEQYEIVLQSI